ncbi:hypothetical protein ACEUZ9_000020 [Paracoccus litorisediminis]|uniref:hypothetical protein n=1 Tax=Paracoccus litorisediminis TaxID=2006130 RepID=UPI00372E1CA6
MPQATDFSIAPLDACYAPNGSFVRIADRHLLEMLRHVSNGCFGECRRAASAVLERRQRAARAVDWIPGDWQAEVLLRHVFLSRCC